MKRTLLKTLLAAAVRGDRAARRRADQAQVGARLRDLASRTTSESVWAADEIKKRTNGKFEIQVFPASRWARKPTSTRACCSARST